MEKGRGRRRLPIVLIAVPLVFLLIFFNVFLVPSSHDPNWKRSLEKKIPVKLTPQRVPQLTKLADIKAGVHFVADYDPFKFSDPVDPYRDEGASDDKKSSLFHYITGAGNQSADHPFIWVSQHPRIAYFPNFISESECDALIHAANSSLQRSAVVPHNKGENNVQDIRTSSQAWLSIYEGIGKVVSDRIYKLLQFPEGSSEALQILHYDIGQKYVAHHDYFDPAFYGKQETLRAATMFLYLNDVEAGGETWFPSADSKPVLVGDYGRCTGGLKVKPKRGSAALFYDLKPSGALDPQSMHGSCPVEKGVKWGGTLWFRVKSP